MERLIAKSSRVLVVEDDALLRLGTLDALEDAGVQTLEACSADEALKLLESRDDIRVVFSDIQMPGSMDGVELAAIIRRRWPQIRVILTSGNVCPSFRTLPNKVMLMPKPYQTSVVVRMARTT